VEYLIKRKLNLWFFFSYLILPVGKLSSTISLSGTLSRYLIKARSELPCAAISTFFPERIAGTIESCQYGNARSTVSFKHSVNGKTRGSKFFLKKNSNLDLFLLIEILYIFGHFLGYIHLIHQVQVVGYHKHVAKSIKWKNIFFFDFHSKKRTLTWSSPYLAAVSDLFFPCKAPYIRSLRRQWR